MKIIQILPDVFEEEVKTRTALTLQINKKHTGGIVQFLKSFITDRTIYIKYIEETIQDYKFGKYNNQFKKISNDFIQIDISFLKMVKSVSNEENIILIGFLEVFM